MPKFALVGKEDPINPLCKMVHSTKYADLPADVINYARLSILDTLGVIIGGSAMEGIPAVVEMVKEMGGKPESVLPFYGGRVPAPSAAMAIGPMARAMDLADIEEEAGHCTEYTLATLLAATGLKKRVTGKEFITALVVGQEVLIRIGRAFKSVSQGLPVARADGQAIFGAVAAAGKLLGFSLEELLNAQGMARTLVQPHALSRQALSLMMRVHHGFVCHDAIIACLLTKRGVTASWQEVLAAPKGFLGLATWETDPSELIVGLGEDWKMTRTLMKPYTSCKGTHASTYGLLEQMNKHKFRGQDIASIDVDVPPQTISIVCTPREAKWHPQTVPECQFSLPYVVASAAYDGGVFLDCYTPEARARREVRDLMTRISARAVTDLPSLFAARVTTTLKDGRKFSEEYAYVKGHYKNPFTELELIDKFKRCVPYSAYRLSQKAVDSVIKAVLSLEQVEDVESSLLLPLTPAS